MHFISSKKVRIKISEITDYFIRERAKCIWQQTLKIYLQIELSKAFVLLSFTVPVFQNNWGKKIFL